MFSNHRRWSDHIRDFLDAAYTGNMKGIYSYIKSGYNVNEVWDHPDHEGHFVSALSLAVERGHLDCVKTLLRFGADMGQIDQFYTKGLFYASHQGMTQTFRELAALGMFKSEKDDESLSRYKELIDSVKDGELDKVNDLVSNLSEQMSANNEGVTTLCFLILSGCGVTHLTHLMDTVQMDVNGYNRRGFTPLIAAVISGNLEVIDFLIQRGADVNKREKIISVEDIECRWVNDHIELGEGETKLNFHNSFILNGDAKTPVMYAVWTRKAEVVKHLLQTATAVNIEGHDSQQQTVLTHALYVDNVGIVNELLRHGINVKFRDTRTWRTVLFEAVIAGSGEAIFKLLLNLGVEKNATDCSGRTALQLAAMVGRANVLKALLTHAKFDINYINTKIEGEYSALMYAANENHLGCLKILINFGADVSLANRHGETALHVAAQFGDVDSVKFLLEEITEGEKHENTIGTTVHYAAKNENSEVLKILLPHCTNYINELSHFQKLTPLMASVKEGVLENVKLLLQHGADVNKRDQYGKTAIIYALEKEDLTSFNLLIEAGADVDTVTDQHDTLLVNAAAMENVCYLDSILKKGTQHINTLTRAFRKPTPLITAITNKRMDGVRLLLDYGADVNLGDKDGVMPIEHAAQERWRDGVKVLVEAGADITQVSDNDRNQMIDGAQSWGCVNL